MVTTLKICAALVALPLAAAHSWIACTDIQGIANPKDTPHGPAETDQARYVYNDNKCGGYARGYHKYATEEFGRDMSYNYQPANGGRFDGGPKGPMCQWGADDYSDRYNKPSYAPGSTVCIQYPAKNHVASPTTDHFMPDTSFKIFRSVNPGEKPDSTSKMIELFNYNEKHVQGTIDYKGFQNCPGFAANNDKAVCTACFDVGATPATGEYMFVWEWFFNENLSPYTTCWDAFVGAGGGNMVNRPVGSTTAIQAPQGSSTGGSTSNNSGSSNSGSGSSNNSNSGSSNNSGSSGGNAQDGGHPPNPNCEHGILDPASGACCASSCGSCGGDNCHAKEGGAECCCASLIKTTNRSCSHEIAPCMVDGFVPQTSSTPAPVTPAAAPAPAPAPVPAVVTPPVPVPAAEPVPAVVAPVPETPATPPAPAATGDVPPAAVVDNTPATPAAPAPVPAPVPEDNSNNGNNNSGEQPQTPAEPAPAAPVPEDNGNNNNNGGEQPQTPAEPAPAAPVVDTPVVVEPAPAAPVEDNSGSNNNSGDNNSSGNGDSAEAQASQDNSGPGNSEDHSQ